MINNDRLQLEIYKLMFHNGTFVIKSSSKEKAQEVFEQAKQIVRSDIYGRPSDAGAGVSE